MEAGRGTVPHPYFPILSFGRNSATFIFLLEESDYFFFTSVIGFAKYFGMIDMLHIINTCKIYYYKVNEIHYIVQAR